MKYKQFQLVIYLACILHGETGSLSAIRSRIFVVAKSVGFGLKAALGVSAVLICLAAGSAMAGTVTTSTVSLPNGSDQVNIVDTTQNVDGGGNNLISGTIGLQTTIGALSTYCVDLFDYINLGNNSYTFNQNTLTAGSTFSNGSAPGTFTQAQVTDLTRLLAGGATPVTQSSINSAALQVAIWETEYGTAAANGSYNLTSGSSFYFTPSTNDSNSAAVLAQAQSYLNAATGYQNGSAWVAATWQAASNQFVEYLTSNPSGTQNLIYLATPEPSTVAVFGIGLIGLWAARRRKMI
jgi:hypothetical protein